jgi:hypothetical protein
LAILGGDEEKVMRSDSQNVRVSKPMVWVGWIIGLLPALALILSSLTKLAHREFAGKEPDFVEQGFEHLGWDISSDLTLGILELVCTVVYLVPRTAVLGAVLVTGYLGGAIATHVRIHEPVITQVILGVLVWGGLYFREPRLRALLPFRK